MTLDWILGRCDSLRAEVFLRVAVPPGVDAATAVASATLTGPSCRRAITLPVTARFSVMPHESTAASLAAIVVRAILTEPSYWTPELPSLYRLEVRLASEGRELAAWERTVGLRRAGVRGRSLWLDGRRYVPRGLMVPADAVDVELFRDAAIAAVVADPPEQLLERCDAAGVAVLGVLTDATGHPFDVPTAVDRVTRWAWHPCVLMAVVPREAPSGALGRIVASTSGRQGTVLMSQEVDGAHPPPESVEAADALVVSLAENAVPHAAWKTAAVRTPAVARWVAAFDGVGNLAKPSRHACDLLQASLAGWATPPGGGIVPWDWAGYLSDAGIKTTRTLADGFEDRVTIP